MTLISSWQSMTSALNNFSNIYLSYIKRDFKLLRGGSFPFCHYLRDTFLGSNKRQQATNDFAKEVLRKGEIIMNVER